MMIDIVIPCYERTPILDTCLRKLKEYTKNYNLILIEGKRSAAANRALGIRQVKSDWFVMLDDDVLVTEGWLNQLLKLRREDVGQIQPKVLFADGKIFSAGIDFFDKTNPNIGFKQKDKGKFNYVRERELLNGCCSLYNSKILEVCEFDENYKGSQYEDLDFSMQIKKAGYKLIYCGKSTVYHYALYRNPLASENFKYYKQKWFKAREIREITRRGVLYTGYVCDLNCVFCYYRFEKKTLHPLELMKKEAHALRYKYDCEFVDITGGEPTIHPEIIEFVRYCKEIGLLPTIITHGQKLENKDFCKSLKEAGIKDFLISCHGTESIHDKLIGTKKPGYKSMRKGMENLNNLGIPFRTNTVITKQNYKTLPDLAQELIDVSPTVCNFISFNPFQSWRNKDEISFQARHSDIAPYMKEAVKKMEEENIEVNVRYFPFCQLKGFEKNIMNYPQLSYDKWEWEFSSQIGGSKYTHEYQYLARAKRIQNDLYKKSKKCLRCSLRFICDGFTKEYVNNIGFGEEKPYEGILVIDPLYFTSRDTTLSVKRRLAITTLPLILHYQLELKNRNDGSLGYALGHLLDTLFRLFRPFVHKV